MEELGRTKSLCPVCLRRLPARLVRQGRDVVLERDCPEHGSFRPVVWSGEPDMAAWTRPKPPATQRPDAKAPSLGCPFDCGLCAAHGQHTCTTLVEVTGRCDLGCPVCFAQSGKAAPEDPSLALLTDLLTRLRAEAGPCNLQLSGGEPTMRQDLPEIVAAARRAGFAFVQLNTNGLRLADEPALARRLAGAGLASVFLQFDGSDRACLALRGRPLLERKLRAVQACADAGLGVVFVPTLARGVNVGEAWSIVRTALEQGPAVRGVHFQPLSAFGRHPGRADAGPGPGPTLPEVLTALVEQSGGQVGAHDLHPPGCEHAWCSFSGVFLRRGNCGLVPASEAVRECGCAAEPSPAANSRTGGAVCAPAAPPPGAPIPDASILSASISGASISAERVPGDASPPASPGIGGTPTALEGAQASRAFTARQWAAQPPQGPTDEPRDDFDRFLAQAGAERRFTLSCMAFMDAWTLDLDRTRGCCIHVAAPGGGRVPFCLYNLTASDGRTLYRGQG